MTKRSFFLLLAAFAILSGGLFTLRGTRTRVRLSRRALDPVFRPVSDVPPSPTSEPEPSIFSSHIAAVLVAAVIFGTGAYFGLGSSESVDADAAPTASPAPTAAAPQINADISIRDEVRAMIAFAATLNSKATAEPSPEPAVAAAVEAPQPAPEPEPQPAAAPAVEYQIPTDGFEAIICAMPWPCAEAIAVASCESGLDRYGRLDGNWATNGNNYGLFQINSVHADISPDFYEAWMDPVKNTEWAYQIWSTSGWWPWQCQP